MLRKDELANSQLDFTAALLMELRKVMASRQKRKSVAHTGNCSTTPGGGTHESQRSSAQLAGKRKANELASSSDSSEPATRRPGPSGGTAPLSALVADIMGEQAADRSRQLGSPEDGVMYGSIPAGFFAPKKPSGSLAPRAKGSDPSEPTVSSEADSRSISLSDMSGPLKDKDGHADTFNHAHLAHLDYSDRFFCTFSIICKTKCQSITWKDEARPALFPRKAAKFFRD